jgi:hypothetical protein
MNVCEQFLKNQTVNPETGRAIKIGGPTHKRLMKQCAQGSPKAIPMGKKGEAPSVATKKPASPPVGKKVKVLKAKCVGGNLKWIVGKGCFEISQPVSPPKSKQQYTQENIKSLKPGEIFVFGSNLSGIHGSGSARMAYEKFGAKYGVGVGMTGHAYALPTKDEEINTLSISRIKKYVNDLHTFVLNHPKNHFIITRVGCGKAGYTDKDIGPLFKNFVGLPNVSLPKSFVD